MIDRAALVVALVLICSPQQPNLVLPDAACVTPACAASDAGQSEQEAALRRLHRVRAEIRSVRGEVTPSRDPEDGEVALQKAGDLPGLIARLDDAVGSMLSGERR